MKSKLNPVICLAIVIAMLTASVFALTRTQDEKSRPGQQPQTQPQQTQPQRAEAGQMGKKDVLETAAASGEFTTFTKAVEAAGLTETLKGPGPYTIFAPTDEAFAKLPAGRLDALMQDKEGLKKLLMAHVVSGNVASKDVSAMKSAKTLGGSSLEIKGGSDKVMVGSASITKPDLVASNGVIHAIDTVIMPMQ